MEEIILFGAVIFFAFLAGVVIGAIMVEKEQLENKKNKPSTPKPDYPPPVRDKLQMQVIELHVKYDDFPPSKLPKTEEKQPIPSYKVEDPCSYCEANSSKCETCRDAGDYRVFYNYDGWLNIKEIGDGNYRRS